MINKSENNKRIAKNTLALYIRTLITLSVGLFTSRLVLNALGVDNFGIYNVVGGVVAMFSIISGSLSQAISRYLTYELGKGDNKALHRIFCTSINTQILMSLIVLILMETIGLWFLNTHINIAEERMYAAIWVFQFSIIAFIVNLISVPYNAAIIAHERMKAFAYVSIFEALMKLIIVVGLYYTVADKLITYAFLLLMVSLLLRLIYGIYCKRHFEECHYSFVFDKSLFKNMFKFAGWNFVGATAYIFNTQGINIISNLFFGVTINAARGIAMQVDSITRGFVLNFTTAIKPQIVKSYSSGDKTYMTKLVCSGAKYSFFLMFLFALPFMMEAETILTVWLKLVPDHAANFVRLTMLYTLATLLGDTLYTNIQATGILKKYMLYETAITLFVFPLTYLLFSLGAMPEISYWLFAAAYAVLIGVRLFYLRGAERFPVSMFMSQVIRPVLLVTIFSATISILIKVLMPSTSLWQTILNIILYEMVLFMTVLIGGLTSNERSTVMNYIKKIRR